MKKILDFIFETVPEEENEEVVVNAPLVKHTFTAESTPKKDTEVKKESQVKKEPSAVKVSEEAEIKKQDTVRKTETVNRKPTFGIEVNDLNPKKEYQKPVSGNNHNLAKKEKEYEFQPPMSPIFGVLENHDDPRIIVSQNKKTVVATSSSYLGTVLSPIYGSEIVREENERVTSLDAVEETETVKEEIKEETLNLNEIIHDEDSVLNVSFEEYFNDEEIKDEDIANSSIEDILVKPKDETQIINREISLFDDEEE